jgi:dTDP-4-dehydrorhamnose reductase
MPDIPLTPRIVLFGATSILGFHLAKRNPDLLLPFTSPGHRSAAVRDWPTLNLENPAWIEEVFDRVRPHILIYGHAVCDVPKCQVDPGWAYEVNVGHLQRVLHVLPDSTRFVYISSDHVFGGDGIYDESSTPCPISVYGSSRVEAEQRVLNRPHALVLRTGLAIGRSPNGRTGHLDWLRYRRRKNLPITIVEDEFRSVVWAEDLADRVMKLAQSGTTGLRHITATQTISRVTLAQFLLKRLGREPHFVRESRHQRMAPHLGHVALASIYGDPLSEPLPGVLELSAHPAGHTATILFDG